MTYLLDTCVLSELVKPRPAAGVISWLRETPQEQLFVSVMTVGELRRGTLKLPDSRKKTSLTHWLDALLTQYEARVLLFDLPTAERWAAITAAAARDGQTLALADSYIAATAAAYDLTLVTRNVRDFEAAGADLWNPWESKT